MYYDPREVAAWYRSGLGSPVRSRQRALVPSWHQGLPASRSGDVTEAKGRNPEAAEGWCKSRLTVF